MCRHTPAIAHAPVSGTSTDGFGCLRGPHGALPLKSFTADLAVTGPVWRWQLRQTFVNAGRDAIEAVYIFPLPPHGAVAAFRMRVAGRTVTGELQERQAARVAYQQALDAGRRAALLEEDRPDVFTIQVGNLQPGELAEIELELSGPVAVEDGIASVRLPLVVAPRYIPGTALGDDVGAGTAGDTDQVPDASRISPPVLLHGFPNPVRLAITMALAGIDDRDLACSLPTLDDGAGRWRVQPGQRLDRDFIVRWRARGALLAATALGTGDAADGGCTLAVSIVPPEVAAAARRPRDVVVLLDRSGSMSGWKMVAARRAAARLVDALDVHDRFAALAFDDHVEGHAGQPRLHAATDRERFAAVTWLAGITDRGGTEMDPAFAAAFALLADTDPQRERILVLITDAQVGNEDHLLKRHAQALARTRVIALGIDQAVNEGLLQRLVAPNGGWQACVESEDWLDRVLALAARMVQPPALADIRIETPEGPLPACTPDPLPDAWGSRPLTVWSRLPALPRSVTVRGTLPDGQPWSSEVPVQGLTGPALHAAWARGRIRDLEDRNAIAASGELAAEIVRVSLREGVLSRFTAFVAIDREVAGNGKPRTVVQAVEQPAGWDAATQPVAASPMSMKKAMFRGGPMGAASRRAASAGAPPPPTVAKNSVSLHEAVDELMCLGEPSPHKDPAILAKALRDRLAPLATDRVRLALSLRAQRTRDELKELLTALANSGHGELVKLVTLLLQRISPPATMDMVADCWPDLDAALIAVTALAPPTGSKPPKPARRGFRFWG